MRKVFKRPYLLFIRISKKIRNFFMPTARILLYHRVANVKTDPHLLCVSPENFRNQIQYLKENFKIVPLVKLVQDTRTGKIQNNNLAITFDDGYSDNLYNALPILEEFNIPATIFLTVGYIGQDKPFYWDENTPLEERGRPMTLDEIKRLSGSHLVEIGGHTINHPKLAKIEPNEQFKEISEGKKLLEKIVDFPLLSFAYPFGGKDSFDDKTIELVKKAGFHYACANIHERVTNKSDIYALPRFIARNWTVEELKEKIKKWV